MKYTDYALITFTEKRKPKNTFMKKTLKKQTKTATPKSQYPDYFYLGISPEAKVVFDAIAANYPDDICIPLDFATLAIFANSVVKFEHLNARMGDKDLWYETSTGSLAAHPARDEMSMLQKQIHYCSAKLGLTPDARNKIKLDATNVGKNSETKTGRKANKKAKDTSEESEEAFI